MPLKKGPLTLDGLDKVRTILLEWMDEEEQRSAATGCGAPDVAEAPAVPAPVPVDPAERKAADARALNIAHLKTEIDILKAELVAARRALAHAEREDAAIRSPKGRQGKAPKSEGPN